MAATAMAAPMVTPAASRLAVTSVFGDALDPLTWSGAPHNLATQLRRLGTEVISVNPPVPRRRAFLDACRHVLLTGGRSLRWESVMRDPSARMARAAAVTGEALQQGFDRILHTGTLDLPDPSQDGRVRHYLYCDHTWNLALRYRPEGQYRTSREMRRYEEMERASYAATSHIFTFGRYVRDNLIEHYRVPRDKVTAVGSGMGRIRFYDGPKDYSHGPLIFIAKHLFVEKGGYLALKAFRLARRRRPDLRLIIAGNDRWRRLVGNEPGVHVVGHLPWASLEALLHSSSLLLQPMFNDPWGQVYLEALASRTPVLGLDRNGLREITEDGRHGFLAAEPDPAVVAETILDAMANTDRLAGMGLSGQRHVRTNYSWEKVARTVAGVLGRQQP